MKLKMLDLWKQINMTLEAQKIELAKQVLGIQDKSLLDKLTAVLSQKEDEIIGYTVSGQALTKNTLKKEILQADRQLERGDSLNHEEVKEAVSKW